ncbi:CGNR zinc finger domain-containing protein [Saccharopolyspora shandongensis]|uniref:CGNR zinc finger domain-containing protein n=1 Tax=Saccharopolyspora shandongensis TaxID=418495 RepID=UPI0033E80B6F
MPQPQTRVAADPRPLTGEPLCLDLLNTRWIDDAGPHDLLESTDGLATWLHTAGLHHRAPASAETLQALLDTRETLLALVNGEHSPETRNALNAVLAHGAVHHSLASHGPEAHESTDEPHWLPAWLAAADYLKLLDAAPGRIKHCGNCILHFYDTTKNGTRRWCSMAICGNRAKAARHYERTRTRSDRH